MIAKIDQFATIYKATFERNLRHSVATVWEMLTNNEKLALWFDELRVGKLGKDGYFKFDLGDGTYETMDFIDYREKSILEFTWGTDFVRFELYEETTGCKLVLIEKIAEITDHTPKDLAGWHVCLDVIIAILDNEKIEDRMKNWKYWYEQYKLKLPI